MAGRVRSVLGRRRFRWPAKAALAGVVLLLTLFPRLDLLVKNVGHWRHLSGLIDPHAEGLDPLVAKVEKRLAKMPSESRPAAALRVTQEVVYDSIPYAWDWDTWGNADYVPRVEETLRAGREDCDGQAVVAASILARLGYDARLMSDMGHVWVWTPQGQTMSPSAPASGKVFVQQDDEGNGVLNWDAVLSVRAIVHDWGRNLAYSIAVFPAWREAVIIAALWVLVLARRPRWGSAIIGLLVTVAGWQVIRETSAEFWKPAIGWSWTGLGLAMAGFVVAGFSGRWRGGASPVAEVTPGNPDQNPAG